MNKVVLADDQECKFITIGKLVLSSDDAMNIESFAPPSQESPHWRFFFKNGDIGISDGNVFITYGQKRKKEGKAGKLLSIPKVPGGGSKRLI